MGDILRVLDELNTFTSDDVARALEMTRSGANFLLAGLFSRKWLERVKSGHNYVYALSDKAKRRIAKLPAISGDERVLPISFEGVEPEPGFYQRCCEMWDMGHIVYEEIEPGGMIGSWTCCGCGRRHPVAVYNPH